MIFGKFTLEIPLKFSACGGLGGAGFGFLKFHELGGARFGSRLRKIILRGVRVLTGGAFNANSLVKACGIERREPYLATKKKTDEKYYFFVEKS